MPLLIPLFIALAFLRLVVLHPFEANGGAMLPTLPVGSHFLVAKRAYATASPQPGDVVVFRRPNRTIFVARIVAGPGDAVQMVGGILTINGDHVVRQPIDPFPHPAQGQPVRQYIETLPNGRRHRILEASGDTGLRDTTPKTTVPADLYFVLGDNRDRSIDSREGWFVAPDSIIGQAFVIHRAADGNVTWAALDALPAP